MTNSNKIIIVLVLASLLATVIGSWLIFTEIDKIQCTGPNQGMAPTNAVLRYADSGRATLTIAPVGPRNIASGRVMLEIE
jgi:hypothetical protein